MQYQWDQNNVPKVLAHQLTPAEAEEAYEDPTAVDLGIQSHPSGEVRESVLGQTAAGKVLVVIAIALDEVTTRIITASGDSRTDPDVPEIEREGTNMKKRNTPPVVQAPEIPEFASEAEEAEWYAQHPEILARLFRQARAQGLPIRRAERVTAAETATVAVNLRLTPSLVERARRLAARKGMRYQTYMKMVLTEALGREEKLAAME